jgi:putative phosphoribosyl transferase
MFSDRQQAGNALGHAVKEYLANSNIGSTQVVVVALPRGGVPVGYEVAKQLQCPLTVCCAKKIPCPGQPEYAIGAISSSGVAIFDPSIRPYLGQLRPYLQQQSRILIPQARQREDWFLRESGLAKEDVRGKIAIVVDDGIATGMTAVAALRTLKGLAAEKLLLATPVVCANNVPELRHECDDVIALLEPQEFYAVGQFYVDFTQTSDDEVISCLRNSKNFSGSRVGIPTLGLRDPNSDAGLQSPQSL